MTEALVLVLALFGVAGSFGGCTTLGSISDGHYDLMISGSI